MVRFARAAPVAFVVAVVLAAISVSSTAAHDGALLQLGAERIQPGGTVEVHGDLGAGDAFDVALIADADGSRRVIATIPATEEGHFQSFVVVPADVPAGEYLVEVAVDLTNVRAPLTITGSPIDAAGGEGPEQEEGLVRPLPPGFGGGQPASAAPGVETNQPDSTSVDRSSIAGAVAIGVAGILGAALFGGLRRRKRWRSAP